MDPTGYPYKTTQDVSNFHFSPVRQPVILPIFVSFLPSCVRFRRSFHSSVIHRCDVPFLSRIGLLVLAFFHKLPGWSIRSATATASAAASFGREKFIVGWTSGAPICTAATVASLWSAATSAAAARTAAAATTRSPGTPRQSTESSSPFAAPRPQRSSGFGCASGPTVIPASGPHQLLRPGRLLSQRTAAVLRARRRTSSAGKQRRP